jgi:hypothetical protein
VFDTRGDANNAGERWTSPRGAELGRSLVVLPYAGYLVGALTQPLVAGCLAAIAAVLIILAPAGRIRRRLPGSGLARRFVEACAHRR